MSKRVPFTLVDVFADKPLTGNPLTVVPDADGIAEELLPRIAREFNQTETTFLLAPTAPGADWRLRSLTQSGIEVYGAGHNALGAWWWLAENGRLGHPRTDGVWRQQFGEVVLPLRITMTAGRPLSIGMRQRPPAYLVEVTDLERLADGLHLDVSALGASPDLPTAQVVSTDAAHLLVGVRDREQVDAAAPDLTLLRPLVEGAGGEGVYLYALNPAEPEADAHTRFVNPVAGIIEDPATGTAAGPLACLLHRYGHVSEHVTVMQGHLMGRPSRIEVVVGEAPEIVGRAVQTATGELALPHST